MSEGARGGVPRISWPRPFAGLQGIKLADVPREASAGITLAALMIPLNIGYAQVAGLPPVGESSLMVSPFFFAVFRICLRGGRRHLECPSPASLHKVHEAREGTADQDVGNDGTHHGHDQHLNRVKRL